MRFSIVAIVLAMVAASATTAEAMSCSDCQSLVEDLGKYCSKTKEASYSAYCRSDDKYISNRYKLAGCRQVTKGIEAFSVGVLGIADTCQVVSSLVGDKKRQQRHQICCDDFVHCQDQGDFRCPQPRFAVPFPPEQA